MWLFRGTLVHWAFSNRTWLIQSCRKQTLMCDTLTITPTASAAAIALFAKHSDRELTGQPCHRNLRWGDGNGHSHLRAALLGPSLTIPFIAGRLALGTWQQILYVDFDNRPRLRELVVQIMGE
jgi:hypothetical protein